MEVKTLHHTKSSPSVSLLHSAISARKPRSCEAASVNLCDYL